MGIEFDKILWHIAQEKALHPNNEGSTGQEQAAAWARIGRLHKLSVQALRSMFVALQKKYAQEKLKGNSTWKLFGLMAQIHQEPSVSVTEEDENVGQPANSATPAASDGESPTKSQDTSSPEKEKGLPAKPYVDTPRPAFEEKKLPNNNPRATTGTSLFANVPALHKKGVAEKLGSGAGPGQLPSRSGFRSPPDSRKRKLIVDHTVPVRKKKPRTSSAPTALPPSFSVLETKPNATAIYTTTAQLMQMKIERESNQTPPPGIDIITILSSPSKQINGIGAGRPTSSTAATFAFTSVASSSVTSTSSASTNGSSFTSCAPEIMNFGHSDTLLPPSFSKNLCNSSRHEALGLYVANIMNRLSSRVSAKLELSILRAIINAQSDEVEVAAEALKSTLGNPR